MVPARDKRIDAEIYKELVKADPSVADRVPHDFSALTYSPSPLAKALNEASPEVRKQVMAAPNVGAALDSLDAGGKRPAATPAGVAGPQQPGVQGAAGAAGPQASIDASDLKEAAGMLKAAAMAMGGGGPSSGGRRGRDLGPMPDFGDAYGPGRAGGMS